MAALMQTDNLAQSAAILVLITLLFLAIAAYMMSRQQSVLKTALAPAKRRFYTIVECGSSRQVREFQAGDYVGKTLGPCGEGLEAWIIGIYSEEEKQETKAQKSG